MERKKILAIILVVAIGITIPVIFVFVYMDAAKKLEFSLQDFEGVGIQLFPTPSVTLNVGLKVSNPTNLDFPPISAIYKLFVDGVEVGDGIVKEFTIKANSNYTTTASQKITSSSATTLVNKLLAEDISLVTIQITKITVAGIPISVNIEETLSQS